MDLLCTMVKTKLLVFVCVCVCGFVHVVHSDVVYFRGDKLMIHLVRYVEMVFRPKM